MGIGELLWGEMKVTRPHELAIKWETCGDAERAARPGGAESPTPLSTYLVFYASSIRMFISILCHIQLIVFNELVSIFVSLSSMSCSSKFILEGGVVNTSNL